MTDVPSLGDMLDLNSVSRAHLQPSAQAEPSVTTAVAQTSFSAHLAQLDANVSVTDLVPQLPPVTAIYAPSPAELSYSLAITAPERPLDAPILPKPDHDAMTKSIQERANENFPPAKNPWPEFLKQQAAQAMAEPVTEKVDTRV